MPHSVSLHTDPRMAAYGFLRGTAPGGRHYMTADRFAAFYKSFLARGLDASVDVVAASPKASHADLTLFHTTDYVDMVRIRCKEGGMLDHGPTPAEPGMDIAAAAVTGTVLHAARRILSGQTGRAFVPIAGFHHARADAARNYCIYNDVAVLLAMLKTSLPGARIACVDLDVHFGDAVFEAFRADPDVAVLDLHQDTQSFWSSGELSMTESGALREETAWSEVFEPGAGDEALFAVWPEMRRWLQEFRPSFVVFNAGADSLRDDGLGGLALTPAAHVRVARDLGALADRFGQGRMLALGGGGVNLSNLGPCWCGVIDALQENTALGADSPTDTVTDAATLAHPG